MMQRKDQTPPDPATAQNSAMRSLGRREHSASQLKAKLKAKGYDTDTATQTVEQLTEGGWQSDARYAEQLVRSRIAQGYGPQRVSAELAAAGVGKSEISEAIEAAGCDWTDLAQGLHRRKFGGVPESSAERQKQYRYLMGRGFTSEQIRAVLKGEPDGE